jgi:quercetin dioxygenase-like cupin family protein
MKIGTLAAAACVLSVSMAHAQSADPSVIKLPQEIVFKGPLTGPPQTVVLFGDPTKPGVFVSRVKFSAGWKDPPHWHPDTVRTAVVLSGTLYFASGDKWDETKFTAYPPGTFYSEPSKAPHFTWAKDGEVIIQVTGVGPSGKTPVAQ